MLSHKFIIRGRGLLHCFLSQYVEVVVIPDLLISFGGTTEPAASISVMSAGHLGVEPNKAITAAVFALIKDKLGIDGKRYEIFKHS